MRKQQKNQFLSKAEEKSHANIETLRQQRKTGKYKNYEKNDLMGLNYQEPTNIM